MSMKEELEDKVDAYLLDEMTEEERRQFEIEAENDKELKDEIEFTRNVQKALQSRVEKLIAIKGFEKNLKEKEHDKKVAVSHRIYWSSGIAAIFVVGFFLANYFTFNNDANLDFSPQPQVVSAIRGVDMTTENLLAKGDYQEALSRIETLEREIATVLLEIERQRESRGAEEDLSEKQEMLNWRQEGLLILKVETLICLDRMDDAYSLIPQLDMIRQSESDFKEEADSLYNVLRR